MPEEVSPPRYSRRAMARVTLSMQARALSDSARGVVSTWSDDSAQPGEFVQSTAQLVSQAESLLTRAVILERERGTSWEQIGQSLGITRQAAHERFGGEEKSWRSALAAPFADNVDGVVRSRLPEGADDPAKWAADLDEWVVRHREAWDGGSDGPHPILGHLPMATLSEEIVMALDQLHALQDERPSLAPELKVAWQRRKTSLLERIAAARPDDGEAQDVVRNARRRRRDLEAMSAFPTGGIGDAMDAS